MAGSLRSHWYRWCNARDARPSRPLRKVHTCPACAQRNRQHCNLDI
jgi:hypothetical protein